MTWGVVVMEQPFVWNVWSHVNDPFAEPVSVEGLLERHSLPFKNDLCIGHAEDHTGRRFPSAATKSGDVSISV